MTDTTDNLLILQTRILCTIEAYFAGALDLEDWEVHGLRKLLDEKTDELVARGFDRDQISTPI